MLAELKLGSLDELVQKTIPANILREPLCFENESGTTAQAIARTRALNRVSPCPLRAAR